MPTIDHYCPELDRFCPDDRDMIMWQSAWVCKPTPYQLRCEVQERTVGTAFVWIRPDPGLFAEYDREQLGEELTNEHLIVEDGDPPVNFVAKVYEGKLLMHYVARDRWWPTLL